MPYDGTITERDPNLVATFKHEDGSTTYIVVDQDAEHVNPRDDDGNVATLIQRSDRHMKIDDDDAGLSEARERFGIYDERSIDNWSGPAFMMRHLRLAIRSKYDGEAMVNRYLAMFRPDVLLYVDYWVAPSYTQDSSYGWGYVTREAWVAAMGEGYDGDLTPKEAFDQEVDIFGKWARGDVYGYIHIKPDGTEDSVWGFLGYETVAGPGETGLEAIVEQATDSPITERIDAW